MKFRDLPKWVRKAVTDYAVRREVLFDWPNTHPSFQKGKSEALKWVFGATFEDIYFIVSEDMPAPTYIALTAGDQKSEMSNLCIGPAADLVTELLKTDGHPPATEENIQFEAGLHLTIKSILTLLLRLYNIVSDDYGSIGIIDC